MDFSSLSVPKSSAPPTDPFKIFATLPRVHGAPNDLWRGQADALSRWNEHRNKSDVHIGLNTGAGKTIVGLLIAKSFANEGLENVLYLCPTIDLVLQTAKQARAIGLDVTTRTSSQFDNDLFESGRTFCITTYAAVFNGHSALRRRFFPQAVIFDDAHVAESAMRDAFTLRIEREELRDLFDEIIAILSPALREMDRDIELKEAARPGAGMAKSVLIPPNVVIESAHRITASLVSHKLSEHKDLKYPFEHIKDRINRCAIIIRSGVCEITPPFLPSLSIDVFAQKMRRVYLSATLQNKADVVRAFGRSPEVIIEPDNDAGNGERLIIFERELIDKFNPENIKNLAHRHKMVIATSSYHDADSWKSLGKPATTATFSAELDRFRAADRGVFILVSRVDGIDLPNDTCRVMLLDGLPVAAGLLERHQFEFLHMRTFFGLRIANRLVQLFGRINRGRSDYGAFLISSRDLNSWLNNNKNVALLPKLLREQIFLGRHVQSAMSINSTSKVSELLEKVILSNPRDTGWLDFYSRFLSESDVPEEASERANELEEKNIKAAQAEAIFAAKWWDGEFSAARAALEETVPATARSDEKLAGWHNLWIGAALEHEGDIEEARFLYARARAQLGVNLIVPRSNTVTAEAGGSGVKRRPLVQSLADLTSLGVESFRRQESKIVASLSSLDGASPKKMEESVRELGQQLGYVATRPDNEFDKGPDVLWEDSSTKQLLAFELKTDKDTPYNKDDIGQSLNHLNWVKENYPKHNMLGLALVGPDKGVTDNASPSQEIFAALTDDLISLRDQLLALIRDARAQAPLYRLDRIERATEAGWSLEDVSKQILYKPLIS